MVRAIQKGDNATKCLAEFHEEACGDSDGVNERGPWREEGASREEGRANVSLGPSWCCLPGVAVAVGVEEFASVVIWKVGQVAVAVFPVFPPSALLSQEAQGVAAPWWGSPPPTKSAKVFGRFNPRDRRMSSQVPDECEKSDIFSVATIELLHISNSRKFAKRELIILFPVFFNFLTISRFRKNSAYIVKNILMY